MRKIYILILLMNYGASIAQDPRIFENNWYLKDIIKDSVDYFPPANMSLVFNSESTMTAFACLPMQASVTFENNLFNFSATNFQTCLCWCYNPIADSYEPNYYHFFSPNLDPEVTEYFTYIISETENEKSLIISSAYNQKAIFSNIFLSKPDFEKLNVEIYPNPAKDYIIVESKNIILANTVVEIYNSLGEICKSVKFENQMKIGIENLSCGLYIMKVRGEKGINIIKKFVKL